MGVIEFVVCGIISTAVIAVILAVFGQPLEPRPETDEERQARIDRAVEALSRDMGLQDIAVVKRRMAAHQERHGVLANAVDMEVKIDERYRNN